MHNLPKYSYIPVLTKLLLLSTFLISMNLEASICWFYSGQPATNPQPWHTANLESGCSSTNALHTAGSTDQLIGEEHRNFHCINDEAATEAYGRAFLAFHRQFILDFDIWRLTETSLDRLEIWDPYQNAPVPGDNETITSAFTHCASSGGVRPAGAICTGCSNLPNSFIGNNLNSISSIGELGHRLEFEWHGSYHNGVRVLGCQDIGGFIYTSRDPAFWLAHNKLDEVVTDWQALKATDVVIVLDRSGSMDDNCPGGNADPGESPCALNDAKSAALTFADAVLDVRMDGAVPAAQQHRLGLVSFSSGSTAELPLTAANGIVTDNGVDDTGFETALGSINAGGSTSIAGGIREAINMLTSVADPNPHQAILVLTDGKENVAPCLGGNSASSCISADVLTAAEINNIQIVAVGFGPGAEEANLRDIAERHGGVFFAEADVSATLDLQKFFITAMGEIYDAAISLDPKGIIQSGEVASKPFNMEVGSEERLSVIMGSKAVDQERQCDLQLELLTPSGKKVDRSDKGVEAGHGKKHDFMHVALPYQGEAKGTWQGRIVRTGKNRKCKSQDYFYSVLMKGMGRVKPYVLRPNVVVGRKILASFRISEPNRPKGGFDNVTAKVTLTRPDGSTSTHTLYDDGTHGDVMKGNHLWSAELPDPATTPGPHHLRARFKITKDGHTMTREAEYSVVVQPEPKQCFNAVASGPYNEFTWHRPQAGDVLEMSELACLWNLCARDDRYKFEISDSKGWLKTHNSGSDQLVDLPSSFTSEKVRGFAEYCLGKGVSHSNDGHTGGGIPIIATIPKDSKPGDYTDISIKVSSVNGNEQQDIDVKTKLRVSPPPDCNLNKQHDAKDLAEGSSKDQNNNKVPDECEGLEHSNYHQEADHSLIESHWIKWLLALLILLILLALYWRKKK